MLIQLGFIILSIFKGYYSLSILISLYFSYMIIEYIMNDNVINFITNNSNSLLRKGSKLSAGFDISSTCSYIISPRSRIVIDTGIYLNECPNECYLRIAPRSGLSAKGLDIGAGVVDCDYKGEIKVILINNNDSEYTVCEGDFIAQLIPEKIYSSYVYLNNKKLLSNSIRGIDGFGSTDKDN